MSSEPDVATAAKKRTLELEAFSSLVDALRAAGPLTPERKAVLQQTASALKISADRYKAEIRRALAKPNLSGEIDETSWAMEGRRDTFLLPRKQPRATLPAPYAAYTTRLTPALVQLPRGPYKTVETQTVATKVAANPKLVVVSSPRSQTTHTMVYAKPGGQQRQLRACSQQAGTPQLPVVVNTKAQQIQQQPLPQHQQQAKMVTVPTVVRSAGPVISAPATAPPSGGGVNSNNGCSSSNSSSSNSCAVNSTTVKTLQQPATPQQVVVSSASGHHHHVQPQFQQTTQHCKQIVITTPNNCIPPQHQQVVVVDKVRPPGSQQHLGLETVQVRPTIGAPVVTKVLHPNRTSELKVLQKPRFTQVRTTATPIALATMTPAGVRLGPTLTSVTNGDNKVHVHSTSGGGGGGGSSGETVQNVTSSIKLPTKVIKSLSQWNYDDHSVMAKPAAVAPVGASTTTITLSAPSSGAETTLTSMSPYTQQQPQQYVHHQNVQHHPAQTAKIQLATSQTRTVQIVQMSVTNAQTPTTPPRVPKPVRLITPSQVSGGPPPSHGGGGGSSSSSSSCSNMNNNSSSSSSNNNNNNNNSNNNNYNNNNNSSSGNSSSNHNNNNFNSNNNNSSSSNSSSSSSSISTTSTQGYLHGRRHLHGGHATSSTTTTAAATTTLLVTTTTTAAAATTTTGTGQQPRPSRDSASVAVSAATKAVNSNVVVQSLPYQDYQGSIYKMVPEDVIMEEEVA